jgi:transcriptional regulator with XRE-family HTH domain
MLNLSQQELADKVGLQRNTISLIENGRRNASERTIRDICSNLNVNENWLKSGQGDTFIEASEEDSLLLLLEQLKNSESDTLKVLVKKITYLNEKHLKVLEVIVDALIEKSAY